MGPAALQEGNEDGHGDRGAAYEDTRYRGFRGTFRGDHGEVEADHADGRQQRETHPSARCQHAQGCRAAPSDEREEQQAGEAVTQELAARVRVVAEDAVGGEGASDKDGGERREQHPAGPACGGGVHGSDAT
ncbi:hypothetical protein GCM10017557_71060 [Streptomyces aurantiacus]|uniref:Uncharacterized protein n=1 Tax=Streptomyces aurantiacus TaxID=47760 RepID=A0A7G1PET3_9ACTN|nr:hypothetical protein GCM10017557_71060 [Streptomyces aurantiacus]